MNENNELEKYTEEHAYSKNYFLSRITHQNEVEQIKKEEKFVITEPYVFTITRSKAKNNQETNWGKEEQTETRDSE